MREYFLIKRIAWIKEKYARNRIIQYQASLGVHHEYDKKGKIVHVLN
jgi:hypothetical protein